MSLEKGDVLLRTGIVKHFHTLFDAAVGGQVVAADCHSDRIALECTRQPPYSFRPGGADCSKFVI